jgi:hypothetical protein
MFGTGPGIPPAVRVSIGNTVLFSSRLVKKPNPEVLAGPNPETDPSTPGFCRVWLDLSVPVSGSHFRVFLFMVVVKYIAVICKIVTFVHHSLYLFHL